MLYWLFLSDGRREEAEEQVRRWERYVERSGDARQGIRATACRAGLAALDGRFAEALARALSHKDVLKA